MKYMFRVSLGFVGDDIEEVFDFPDGTDEETVYEHFDRWIEQHLDCDCSPIEEFESE